MVATTRAVAARQQQTSNAEPIHTLCTSRKNLKKKKTIIDLRNSSATNSSSLESITITSTLELTTTANISSSTAESYHHNTNDVITMDCVSGINDTLGMDDAAGVKDTLSINDNDRCIRSSLIEFNETNDKEESKSNDLDDDKELDILKRWPVVSDEIEWCKTNRGNERLCMSGYTYDYMSESLKKNVRNFRCSKKGLGCRAVVYVFMDSNMYKGTNNVDHNHPPNHHHIKRLLVLQKVKERVMTEPTSVTRIIEDEYVKSHLNNGERQYFLLPSAQASKFYKIRSKMAPPNPRSLDFEVPELYTTTHSGEEFLMYDSTHKKLGGRLMIFSTEILIKMLCNCEVILIDGTFKTRPAMFSQVYVIMGKHLAEAIPMVWCLAPKRTQEVYEKIFKVLKNKSTEYGLQLTPKIVYMDFEVATIKALEKIFPDIVIHGCWYHFTQSIFRNIQKIGLAGVYEKNEDIKIWLKSFMALPLIKPNAVEAVIQLLIENVPSSDKLLIEFYEYFQHQWTTRVPIRYWSLGPIHLRCNNNVEGYNNRLQHRFGVHPQLWSFIHFLKGEESLVMMRAAQIRSGNYRHKAMPFSVGNERLKQKTKQLKNLARLFELGTINLKKYINSLSSFVGESATKKKQNDHIDSDGSQNNVVNSNNI